MKKKQADLILINGTVFTLDDMFSTTESFAVKEGKILKTGTSETIHQKYAAAEIIDAHGKFVYPGFNDAHSHFNTFGEDLIEYADLSHTHSPEEIYDILVKHFEKFGENWVLGLAWDQNEWEVQEFPDKSGLDKLFPDIPVYLYRTDIHAAWCNSKALEIGGITADTKVDGGEIVLKDGEPTGILIDNAMKLVSKHIPDITKEQRKKGLDEAQKKCFASGLTSVTDCGLHKDVILTMHEMQQEGSLKIRINAMMNPTVENYQEFLHKNHHFKTERLVVNTIKVFADGALGSRSALLMEDYLDDSGNHGLQLASKDFYEETCQLAYDNNFIMATHCIGDGANRFILDTYGNFLKGKNDRRWRIEHAQIVHPDDFEKFGRFSIVPSVQATHATSEMEWVDQELSQEQLKGAYAYQTLLKQNGWLPNGTDFPVEAIEPLNTFYSAVFRINHAGWPDGGWRTEEALTREQALRSITIWPAKASFEEKEKGSIEPGKYADFVIIDTDLMTASPQEVLNAKIESTWVGGEKVFKNH
jgi:predicted amidohydrolase YtcJ